MSRPKKNNAGHDPAVKAAAVAALLQGQAISHVAAQYNLPEGTVKVWSAHAKANARVEPKAKAAIGELLLQYLQENLTTLREQAIIFRDPDWLRKQTAADAAVLHGVMTDKTVRLLEALERAGTSVTSLTDA